MHCSQISKDIPRNCRALGNQVKCWFSPPCSGHAALVLLTTLPRSPQTISLVITCLVFLGPSLLEPLSVCSNLECSFELFCLFQDSLLLFVCLCFSFSGACQKNKKQNSSNNNKHAQGTKCLSLECPKLFLFCLHTFLTGQRIPVFFLVKIM